MQCAFGMLQHLKVHTPHAFISFKLLHCVRVVGCVMVSCVYEMQTPWPWAPLSEPLSIPAWCVKKKSNFLWLNSRDCRSRSKVIKLLSFEQPAMRTFHVSLLTGPSKYSFPFSMGVFSSFSFFFPDRASKHPFPWLM